MPTIDRVGRLQHRLREIEEGKEIDAKHIDILLGDEEKKRMARSGNDSRHYARLKKPAALNNN